jgi:hypothetical protein
MKSWAIYILAAIGFVIYGAATDVDRDSSGAIVSGGNVDAFNVHVGDCFNDLSSYDQVASVPGVPCSDLHDNETFAVFDVSFNNYPADGNMDELAYDACMAQFVSFVGRDYETSSLEISTMYPSPESWAENDREVVCAVYDVNDNQLIGSAAGRGL